MELEPVSDERAVRQLQQRTGLDDAGGALRVAHELGNRPLALAVAAATTGAGRAHTTYGDYLDALSMVSARGPQDRLGCPSGVHRALRLAVAHARAEAHLSGMLLDLLSVLSPAGAAVGLLDDAAALVDTQGPAVAAAARGAAAVDVLVGRALVTRANAMVTMHPLLQRLIRDDLADDGGLDRTLRWAVDALDAQPISVEPGAGGSFPQSVQRSMGSLRLHVDAVWHHASTGGVAPQGETPRILLRMRRWLLSSYIEVGDFYEAVEAGEELYRDHVLVLGRDDPATLSVGGTLGYTYQTAGQLDRAISVYESVLSSRAVLLGSEFGDTVAARYNLATAYENVGRLVDAVALYRVALAGAARTFGTDHDVTETVAASLYGALMAAQRA